MSASRGGLAGRAFLRWLLAGATLAAGYLAWTSWEETPPGAAIADAQLRTAPALDEDIRASLAAVDGALSAFPPAPVLVPERARALAALDGVLQEEDAGHRPAVQEFFHRRVEGALAQLELAGPRQGATVWHIYNQGFIVRTQAATVCFDLVRAKYLPGFALSETAMRRIVGACDALFVSHVHADHAESFVAQTFVDQDKPVVAPYQIGYRKPLFDKVHHLEGNASKTHLLPLRDGATTLRIVVFPGHQGSELDNNVVLVTMPDGISVAHTGDQWYVPDFEWIDKVARRHKVDILLVNDWTYDIARLVRGFNPAVVIPGHANELGHPSEKRQPYLFSLERKAGSKRFGGKAGYAYPLVIMAWGEAYRYGDAQERRH